MKVYKFGGASIKDAAAVKNMVAVLKSSQEQPLVIVVSAMGKTTNAFEKVVTAYCSKSSDVDSYIAEIYSFHRAILTNLFLQETHQVFRKVEQLFAQLRNFLAHNVSTQPAYIYDQVVSYGEMISSTIIHCYMEESGLPTKFLDARTCIKTSNNYREGIVLWDRTQDLILKHVPQNTFTITQGFIASEEAHNFTTTLGREGSDYTAAIFAYCLNASSVTIWKDVPGVLNADPRHFSETILLDQISYREAIEMAFYGASVIHPKTLQPLQRKEIPLFVKSFQSPSKKGTCVGKGVELAPKVACYIVKHKRVLLSLSSLDFSFIVEQNISELFQIFYQFNIKVELIQNSAISFSVCIADPFQNFEKLLQKLKENYRVKYNENVTLYTVRHVQLNEIQKFEENKTILLKQESRETVQLVVKS